MKKVILFFFIAVLAFKVQAQDPTCGTPNPKAPLFVDTSAVAQYRPQSDPLMVRVFIHVFSGTDGSNLAASESDVMRQFQNMKSFYAPHGICFMLGGYEVVRTLLHNKFFAEFDADSLTQFLVPGMLNVFFHKELYLGSVDEPLNGVAYNIPSAFMSMASWATESTSNLSTLSHEVGHCFGLYHTFQRWRRNGTTFRENVARSGSCKNCETEGDLLCDTQADLENDDPMMIDQNCNYTGNAIDSCSTNYIMEPLNIMAYGQRSCRSLFSAGQGTRMRSFLTTDTLLNKLLVTEENIVISLGSLISGGRYNRLSRNTLSVTAPNFTIMGNAKANLTARSVILSPGTNLAPAGEGYTIIRSNTLCN